LDDRYREARMTTNEDKAEKPARKPDIPLPGPHARPELTNNEKTPGSGMLPDPDKSNEAPSG
jgi:hypothetical protein